jgi:glutathione S-transferase
MSCTLAIVDPAYSSWSLRVWLLFAKSGLPVTVETGHLNSPALAAMLAPYAPARTMPALRIGGTSGAPVVVWESLAIAETLAERCPDIAFWPADPVARGLARSLAAEMHAGFRALRDDCPMNLRRAYRGFRPSAEVAADVARIAALWAAARAPGRDGPWLFGDWSAADAFFAPVAARIATYDLAVGPDAADYVAAHLADPAFLEWRAMALADPVVQDRYELDLPERPWPGAGPASPFSAGRTTIAARGRDHSAVQARTERN